MKENFKILRQKFNNIKQTGEIKPLRKGSTGIGYTFETLIEKKEDAKPIADYKGIEIKTKLGYSKSALTLFNCIPLRNNESAIKYIMKNYSWPFKNNMLSFSNEISTKFNNKNIDYKFKLKIKYNKKKIVMNAYKHNKFIEEVCYWEFQTLERKLKTKLNYLAIIIAYPYKKNNELYYKYLKMTTYKLKSFYSFLQLINTEKIKIHFYIKQNRNDIIENHGVAFKIKNEYIEELFTKLNY